MVTPYFTQQRPPALVAMLPPIEQISYDDGSGGYHRSCSAAAAFTSALKAPGSTTATLAVRVDLDGAHAFEAEHQAAVDGGGAAAEARCPHPGALPRRRAGRPT